MAVGGGTGNTISFSELRAFYTDGNQNTGPISISDYNRGGDKVPSSVAGASTLTSSSGPGTKNDFGITQSTQTVYTGSLQNQSYTSALSIQSDTAYIEIYNNHPDDDGDQTILTVHVSRNSSSIGSFETRDSTGNGALILACIIAGPANNGAVSNPNGGTFSSGNITATGTFLMREVTRAANTIYDITFTNNNTTGDTYTLTSNSTRIGSNSQVYSAGTSRKVKDDSGSNAWQIAYDNVTGAGAGTAGDISVSAPFYTGSAANSMQDSLAILRASQQLGSGNDGTAMSLSYTVLASDAFSI